MRCQDGVHFTSTKDLSEMAVEGIENAYVWSALSDRQRVDWCRFRTFESHSGILDSNLYRNTDHITIFF
jgi:hypothetical protein